LATSRSDGEARTPGSLLAQNTELSSRVSAALPPGTDLQQAAGGFKNLGQFVAVARVSQNLSIPFPVLRAKVLAGQSLGSAIQELKPNANADAEVKRAEAQAARDLEETQRGRSAR
jgi:hypothetical protein